MNEQPKKHIKKIIVFSVVFVIGAVLVFLGFQNQKEISFSSEEDNSISYQVHLKENDFFDEPFLKEGGTYITSLIDHINIAFHYKEKLSQQATGSAEYSIRAIISADTTKEGDASYWSKEYELTEPQAIAFEDTDYVTFDANTTVNYQEYNSILDKFRQEYPVASEGKIKVILSVKNTISVNDFDVPLKSKSEMALSLPLLERAINAKIDTNVGEKDHVFKTSIPKNSILHFFMIAIGLLLALASAIAIVKVVIAHLKWEKEHVYQTNLNKILTTYDGIITNTLSVPDFAGLRQMEVASFEEILDAYSELHLPINYYDYKPKKQCVFFILGNDIVWYYNLRNENAQKRKK